MSQGDLLMQRKRHNNGQNADEDSARRYPNAAGVTRVPIRKSMAETPQFIESLKKHASAKGRPSICLTSPTSGSMDTGYAAVPRKSDDIVVSREERQRAIIEQRKQEEDEVRALQDTSRSDYHSMLRERERIRLRQRTQARIELENKTLPPLCGSARTVAAAQREAMRTVPHQSFVETNRDRIEVNLIRREEERQLRDKRQTTRQDLELQSGTRYALSQSQLQATISASGKDFGKTLPTPELAQEVLFEEAEAQWQLEEEEKDIRRAMDELDALDDRIFKDELKRKEERLAKKRELRAASVRK